MVEAEKPTDAESLFLANRKLAVATAGRLTRRMLRWDEPDDADILQVAEIALWQAAQRFDPVLGNRFSTFAVPYIQGQVLQWLQRKVPVIRPPRDGTRVGFPKVVESLDAPISEEDRHQHTLEDILAGDEDEAERIENHMDLAAAIAALPEKYANVIRLRFGEDRKQAEIAELTGFSQPMVSRQEREALRRLAAMVKEVGFGGEVVGRPGHNEETKQEALRMLAEHKKVAEIAEALNVSPASIYAWARGRQDEIEAMRANRAMGDTHAKENEPATVTEQAEQPQEGLETSPSVGRRQHGEPQKHIATGRHPGLRVSQETRRRIAEMIRAGSTPTEIEQAAKVSTGVVYKAAARMGFGRYDRREQRWLPRLAVPVEDIPEPQVQIKGTLDRKMLVKALRVVERYRGIREDAMADEVADWLSEEVGR